MFTPPRCPYADCARHADPEPGFAYKNGSYRPKCRSQSVPRFVCKTCLRGFSRQTFRVDYRDHRPHLNASLFSLLTSGVGLRQSGRLLGLSHRCTELKARKLCRHLAGLNRHLRGPLPSGAKLQLDELETYEGCRNTRPLTVPLLIEAESRAHIEAVSAPIRPRGRMTPGRLARIAADEKRYGRRKDLSREAIAATLARGAELVRDHESVRFSSDEKAVYPALAREAFGARRLEHERTSSKLPRTILNPLFPINHSEAMARDGMGRLRRESWLASKQGWCLDLALQMYIAYRNYVRRRFNDDEQSAAQRLGWVDRRLEPPELFRWRQDWGERSPHPLGDGSRSVGEVRAERVARAA